MYQGGDVAIALTGVSVCYQLPSERVSSLKEQVVRRMTGRSVKYNEFWALRNVNIEVRRGEAIGLIGRNGAGKSTLLKVIARVLKPTTGRVWIKGNIAPLIELGAGFHPELTGRENIFLNGAMLGFSRNDMKRKFDSIVEFSGLGSFIDTPLRTYSSGMQARLGFSVAADADPNILIIDEALAVGDEAFQQKCVARMADFRNQGVTILYVTHGVDSINDLCPRSILMQEGRVRFSGPTLAVIDAYRKGGEFEDDLASTQKRQTISVYRRNRSGDPNNSEG